MNIRELPSAIASVDTELLRHRLAGLVDPQAEKSQWFDDVAKELAVGFCAALPLVFGLDRLTMWDKIASAIQSGYAKTVGGDLDLFCEHVFESIKAEASRVVSCEPLEVCMDRMAELDAQQRQDFLQYVVTHLRPCLIQAKRLYKSRIAGGNADANG